MCWWQLDKCLAIYPKKQCHLSDLHTTWKKRMLYVNLHTIFSSKMVSLELRMQFESKGRYFDKFLAMFYILDMYSLHTGSGCGTNYILNVNKFLILHSNSCYADENFIWTNKMFIVNVLLLQNEEKENIVRKKYNKNWI